VWTECGRGSSTTTRPSSACACSAGFKSITTLTGQSRRKARAGDCRRQVDVDEGTPLERLDEVSALEQRSIEVRFGLRLEDLPEVVLVAKVHSDCADALEELDENGSRAFGGLTIRPAEVDHEPLAVAVVSVRKSSSMPASPGSRSKTAIGPSPVKPPAARQGGSRRPLSFGSGSVSSGIIRSSPWRIALTSSISFRSAMASTVVPKRWAMLKSVSPGWTM
jgi:hypothetical protein